MPVPWPWLRGTLVEDEPERPFSRVNRGVKRGVTKSPKPRRKK